MNYANGKQINLNDIKKFCQNSDEYDLIDVRVNGNVRYLVNVPSDGWCFMYSFIASFNATHGPKISIGDLCEAIMRQFQLKCETKSLPYEFLTVDQESELLITSQNDSIEEIFKFFLIRYLKHKLFDTFVLDYLPHLIADYFECNITIFTFGSDCSLNVFNEFKSHQESERCVEILFCPDLSHFMALSIRNKIYTNLQTENFEISLRNQFYKKVFSLYDKNLKLINKGVEFYEASYRLESDLNINTIKRHKLIEQFEIYVSERAELRSRFEQKFSNLNNFHNFIKNCDIYSIEIKKIQNFINYLKNCFSLDEKFSTFMSLLLKISSLKGIYAHIQLVLKLSQGCFLIKIPNFGVLVDRLPVRLKFFMLGRNHNQDMFFSFLDSVGQVIDIEKNLIGPKTTLAELNKNFSLSKNFSQLNLIDKK